MSVRVFGVELEAAIDIGLVRIGAVAGESDEVATGAKRRLAFVAGRVRGQVDLGKGELARLGIPYEERTRQSCYGRRRQVCAAVTNITARAIAGTGRAVLLMAHTDSVSRGPGAADDGSGVAVILETLRALKARHLTDNRPVAALFTDGEEKALLGAAA